MNTETTVLAALSEHASNAESLSEMIQTSARAKASYVPFYDPTAFCIRFPSEKSARAFQDAFESFSHASKRTVKRVRAKERARKNWLNTVAGMDWMSHIAYGDMNDAAIDAAMKEDRE